MDALPDCFNFSQSRIASILLETIMLLIVTFKMLPDQIL